MPPEDPQRLPVVGLVVPAGKSDLFDDTDRRLIERALREVVPGQAAALAAQRVADDKLSGVATISHTKNGVKVPRERGLHLYAIAGLWTRRVKLGRTGHVVDRLADLQAGSGEELVLIAWAAGLGDLEPRLHQVLAVRRLHGEWFSPHVTAVVAPYYHQLSHTAPSVGFADWVTATVEES